MVPFCCLENGIRCGATVRVALMVGGLGWSHSAA